MIQNFLNSVEEINRMMCTSQRHEFNKIKKKKLEIQIKYTCFARFADPVVGVAGLLFLGDISENQKFIFQKQQNQVFHQCQTEFSKIKIKTKKSFYSLTWIKK